ncbi:MAG: anion permease [Oscillospiraceae bacterium]|jgi:di/tricarboxylate transporter|nr:anion permease [Oscillospiraceae bacterium]
MKRKDALSIIIAAAGVVLAIVRPFSGLDAAGNIVLGTIIASLAMWMFRPGGGTFFIGLAIALLGGTLAGLPVSDIASGFTSPSLWLLIPAMFFGYVLLKTGLGKRMVFALFKRLRLTYFKILVGMFAVGIAFSLITPSITVRLLILTPIAVCVADACRLPKGDKGRSLISISAWAVAIFPGIGWVNGSLYGPVFTAFLPEGTIRALATDAMWFRAMCLPWMVFTVAFLFLLYLALKPGEKLSVTKSDLDGMYEELGPITRDERVCLAVFVLVLLALGAQRFLPFTTNHVLLAGLILLLFTGVLTVKDISGGISWDTVMFFGMILSFAHLLEVTGISAWLSPALSSLLSPIAARDPLVFALALYLICVVLRFIDVAQGWIVAAILSLAMPMLYERFGQSPFVSLMVFLCASNLFFFRYHQPWVGQVEAVIGEDGWTKEHLMKASLLYAALCVGLLAFCRLYWPVVGII